MPIDFLVRAARPLAGFFVALLVGAAPASAQDCAVRSAKDCARDAFCEPQFGSSRCEPGAGPCRPDMVFKRCAPVAPERRELRSRYRALCLRTGGAMGDEAGASPCVCDRTVEPIAPRLLAGNRAAQWPRLFVEGRGCVDVELLCREHRGRWIDAADVPRSQARYCDEIGAAPWRPEPDPLVDCARPGVTERIRASACNRIAGARSVAPREPVGHCTVAKGAIAAPENLRPYCEVGGRPAQWEALGVRGVQPP